MMPTTVTRPGAGIAPPLIDLPSFELVRRWIHDQTGISLSDAKRQLVSSRLARRIRELGLTEYREYINVVLSDASGEERRRLINAITTNKTNFFREPHHFDFLREQIERRCLAPAPKRLRIWSAGCSTGEEPYTIAMTVTEALRGRPGWDVRILASDIDTDVLAFARAGQYTDERMDGVSEEGLEKHFRSAEHAGQVTYHARQHLRDLIRFRQVNLIEMPWPFQGQFDFIFCRNVIIYFDRATQRRLMERFARQLAPGGYLIVGHSENLHHCRDLFTSLQNTIYRPTKPGQSAAPPAERIRIVAGGVCAVQTPAVVQTVLGSCVAACLYDPEARIGGMNHFMLPDARPNELFPTRYGAYAMELLINRIMRLGGDRRRLKAKVFGAASVLHPHLGSSYVPESNARFVREYLSREGIPIVAERLGGTDALEVRFHTHTGRAQVRALSRTELPAIAAVEETYEHQIEEQLDHGADVTLYSDLRGDR